VRRADLAGRSVGWVDGERIVRAAVRATASRRPSAGPHGLALGRRGPFRQFGDHARLRRECPPSARATPRGRPF